MKSRDKDRGQRRAGQRDDELLPAEDSDVCQISDEAAGSPAGGLDSSGLAARPADDGAPSDAELIDEDDPNESQSEFRAAQSAARP
ncbi:MAG TPA: hypothetical protein VGN12_29360 [Pirellulales bacterium]|jgi:hypothetical protein